MNENKSQYLPALTGIRAVAALMVFLHHIPPFSLNNTPLFIIKFIKEFHIGVTLFFVLSGFIITYKYLITNDFNYKKYLWNRFTRIYPLYFLLTIFTFGITFWYYQEFSPDQFLELLMNLTLLKGFFNNYIFTGIAQAWTLTVEECFYIISPFLALFLFKDIISRMFTLPLLIIFSGLILFYLGHLILPMGFIPNLKFLFNFSFFGRIFEFVLGMALAKFYITNKNIKFKHITLTGSLGILLSIILLSMVAIYPNTGDGNWIGIFINNIFLPLVGIAPLLWGLINEKTWLQYILSSRPFQLLGKSSYAFYLIHVGIFQEYIYAQIPSKFILLLLLYTLSIILYLFMESPAKKLLRKVIKFE